jgi:hypothetical protein
MDLDDDGYQYRVSVHVFGGARSSAAPADTQQQDAGDSEVRIRIRDVLRPEYGLLTWPCSIVLAEYLWSVRSQLRAVRVLEVILE